MIKTVSLETAKLLKENGFRQDTSFDWVEGDMGGMSIARIGYESSWSKYHSHCSSPTTDELLEELPVEIFIDERKVLVIGKIKNGYQCAYRPHPIKFENILLAESLSRMWLWLKQEGLLKKE